MADDARVRRMSVRIREIVAQSVEHHVKDARLGMVTITDARLTADLREVTVFWSVWGDEAVRADSAAALEASKGMIRSAIGRATGLKHTPSLAFVLDAIPENAQHIEELLARAREEDERVQSLAEHAEPAGEANPYREARSGEDESDLEAEPAAE
ncbi:MAG TPA: 30S ribosome-binding factor RbfA [Mycobacteriales bacterium]|jgi:ribosome-binding factor A|nr:30S ribosome-binding factor RbfA [Mycobacteriales bacterium]